jgi:hypothetical protein
MSETADRIVEEVNRAIITRLEEIENRVPSDEEVRQNMKCLMKLCDRPDAGAGMRMWFWKGRRILTLFPPNFRLNEKSCYRLMLS